MVCLGDQVQYTQSLVREGLEEKSNLTVMLLPRQKLDFQDLGHHVKGLGADLMAVRMKMLEISRCDLEIGLGDQGELESDIKEEAISEVYSLGS